MSINEQPKGFCTFLQGLREGEFHHECSEKLQVLIAALNAHFGEYGGEPGARMRIEIGFQLNRGAIDFEAEVITALPKRPKLKGVMWSTKGNNYAFEHPRQPDMFRTAPREAAVAE